MKLNFALTFLALFGAGILFGQTQKGSIMFGGYGSFTSVLGEGEDVTVVEFQPQIGFFVQENFALGGALKMAAQTFGETTVSQYTLAPLARYYFGKSDTKVFAQAQLGYASAKVKFDTESETESGAFLAVGPGVAVFLNNHVAIEGLVDFNRYFGDLDSKQLLIHLGVQVYLSEE